VRIRDTYTILSDEISRWVEIAITMLPNLIVAIIIIIVFYFIGILLRRLMIRIFENMAHLNISISRLIGKTTQLLTVLVGFFISLGVLNLDKTVTSLLAGAGVLGLAFGFAFKEVVSSYISGLLIAIRQPYIIGHVIKSNGQMGTVTGIDLRVTHVENFEGQRIIIPNGEIFSNPIINYSKLGKRRITISLPVDFNEDLEKVKTTAHEALADLPFLKPDEEINVYIMKISDYSFTIEVRLWVRFPEALSFFQAQSDAITALNQAFIKAGIRLPVPQQNVNIVKEEKN